VGSERLSERLLSSNDVDETAVGGVGDVFNHYTQGGYFDELGLGFGYELISGPGNAGPSSAAAAAAAPSSISTITSGKFITSSNSISTSNNPNLADLFAAPIPPVISAAFDIPSLPTAAELTAQRELYLSRRSLAEAELGTPFAHPTPEHRSRDFPAKSLSLRACVFISPTRPDPTAPRCSIASIAVTTRPELQTPLDNSLLTTLTTPGGAGSAEAR
jgi:hypothetical protein